MIYLDIFRLSVVIVTLTQEVRVSRKIIIHKPTTTKKMLLNRKKKGEKWYLRGFSAFFSLLRVILSTGFGHTKNTAFLILDDNFCFFSFTFPRTIIPSQEMPFHTVEVEHLHVAIHKTFCYMHINLAVGHASGSCDEEHDSVIHFMASGARVKQHTCVQPSEPVSVTELSRYW